MAARDGFSGFYNVLFLDNGNSARSIFAEVLLNYKGPQHFKAYSAGINPKGSIHPMALREMQVAGLGTEGLRSKSWREFASLNAPTMDIVFAVHDKDVRETRPAWTVQPISGDWSVPDPITASGTPEEIQKAFNDAFTIIQRRIDLLLNLPLGKVATLATHPQRRAA